jgi:hypothetical protein
MKTMFKGLDLRELVKDRRTFDREVKKALLSTDFSVNGAVIPAEQASEWYNAVRGESKFLGQFGTFYEVGSNMSGELPNQHLGEPITTAGAEPETTAESSTGTPNYDKVTYTCKKLRVRRHITMDALFTAAIGKDSLEQAFLEGIKKRAAVDKELLAFQGDVTTYAASTTPMGLLLKSANGWLNQASSRARVVDAGGAYLTTDLLMSALDEMPDWAMTDDVRWIGNRSIKRDFIRLAAAKTGGDLLHEVYFADPSKAIDRSVIEAAWINVSAIPRSSLVTTQIATPAQVRSMRTGPFQISAANDKMVININAGGNRTVTFTHGLRYPSDLAADINAVFVANGDAAKAQDWEGWLLITTNATGAATSIAIVAVANSIYATLGSGGGITAGTTTPGRAANANGQLYQGSSLMLCDPKQLVFVQSDEIRFSFEYEKNNDSMEFVLFEHVDFCIADPQHVVILTNILKQRP